MTEIVLGIIGIWLAAILALLGWILWRDHKREGKKALADAGAKAREARGPE